MIKRGFEAPLYRFSAAHIQHVSSSSLDSLSTVMFRHDETTDATNTAAVVS